MKEWPSSVAAFANMPFARAATEYQRWYMYGQVEGHGSVGSGREGGGQKKGKKGKKGRGRK